MAALLGLPVEIVYLILSHLRCDIPGKVCIEDAPLSAPYAITDVFAFTRTCKASDVASHDHDLWFGTDTNFHSSHHRFLSQYQSPRRDLSALTLTCQRIRAIAEPILYGEAWLDTRSNFLGPPSFLRSILNRPDLRSSVRHIGFSVTQPTYPGRGCDYSTKDLQLLEQACEEAGLNPAKSKLWSKFLTCPKECAVYAAATLLFLQLDEMTCINLNLIGNHKNFQVLIWWGFLFPVKKTGHPRFHKFKHLSLLDTDISCGNKRDVLELAFGCIKSPEFSQRSRTFRDSLFKSRKPPES